MTKTYTLSNGKTVKVTAKNKRKSTKWGQEHFAYTLTMEVDDKMYKTTFHDSAVNCWHGIGATEKMIDSAIYCIIMDYDSYDYNPVLEDFIDEYGYDPEEKTGRIVYEDCKATYEALNQMFTRSEMEELYDLADEGNK